MAAAPIYANVRDHVRDDERGFTEHPDLPQFYDKPFNTEDEGFIDSKALAQAGLECTFVEFEYDATDEQLEAWFEDGQDDLNGWTPSVPNGDGWLLAGIWDAEDGPLAFYVREVVTA
ncbi:hypothetical protein BJI69_14160 [Luteibacter rhizovicinus DSM 16549]|uniref:Uncharacterized protein n=1 Tax=Luteibacter rhizovicinus DSM 16549 TaxID=1440763 RepID=A0A1L3EV45_9GAMM|nr:hypothetical protein [Luteibacter rhizovicinus]APG04921.1 hypothetical protein BJI69_14160 [Luteibacter rhizovicinus DSM 16549]